MAVAWIIWKARNRKVFDDITLSAAAMIALLADHLGLWVCRARRRKDTTPLTDWCSSLLSPPPAAA
jgi:hypothetical protein